MPNLHTLFACKNGAAVAPSLQHVPVSVVSDITRLFYNSAYTRWHLVVNYGSDERSFFCCKIMSLFCISSSTVYILVNNYVCKNAYCMVYIFSQIVEIMIEEVILIR